jgi:hypothetical protein
MVDDVLQPSEHRDVGPVQRRLGPVGHRRIADLVASWDPTRLVNNASGWTDRGVRRRP